MKNVQTSLRISLKNYENNKKGLHKTQTLDFLFYNMYNNIMVYKYSNLLKILKIFSNISNANSKKLIF